MFATRLFRPQFVTGFFVLLFPYWSVTAAGGQPAPKEKEERPPLAFLTAKPLKINAGDDELKKLETERYNVALNELQERYRRFLSGKDLGAALVLEAAEHCRAAALAIQTTAQANIKLREQYLEFAVDLERILQAQFQAGSASQADVDRVRYVRLNAAIALLQAKRAAAPKKK